MRLFFNSIQSSSPKADEKTYLICIQAGQSNASSNSGANDPKSTIPAPYGNVQSNVIKTSYSSPTFEFEPQQFRVNSFCEWVSGAIAPLPNTTERAGLECKLWKDIADATGKNILLVHLAYGGEGFTSGSSGYNGAWNLTRGVGTTGVAWEHLDDAFASMQTYISDNNLKTESGMVWWFQGENDTSTSGYFTPTTGLLAQAFSRFRAKIGEDAPIFSGGINPVRGSKQAAFVANQAAYVDPKNNYYFMSNSGLNKTWSDAGNAQTGIHLDFNSHWLLADEIKAIAIPLLL